MAVAEAARNVVGVGARPIAITDCLNFGNPERPEVYYQMQQVIGGMAAACEKLGIPVISGNVSPYNATRDVARARRRPARDRGDRRQRVALTAMDEGLVAAAHDCAEGGLAVALAE